jgi:ATP phosphoribosyltransferase
MIPVLLGLPSKGRLRDATVEWFAAHGVEIAREGDERQYAASARGLDGLEVVMLAAGEIPRALAAGRLHLGVTGEDLIRERLPGHEAEVRVAAPMGFGQADLVVAVPAAWVDVETMHDLDEAAHEFRRRHGRRLRIATKYHNLARAFLRRHGVADYRLVDSQGATEAGPKNLTAEAIIDITTSGATLKANHLRPLSDGLILQSQAMLCVSLTARWDGTAEAVLAALEARIGGAAPSRQSAAG